MTTQTGFYPQITLNIILTNQTNQSTRNIQATLPYHPPTRQVHINPILNTINQRTNHLSQAQIFHVDFVNRMKVFLGAFPFNQDVTIGLESVVNDTIQISYKASPKDTQMVDQSEEQIEITETKPKKVKERTIAEAMEAVRQWRMLYDSADESGKRLYTLEGSAKKVGIAKKTLDDYHVHLRIAIQFNFNLDRYQSQKVGILRKFVKMAKQQGAEALQKNMPEYILDCDTDKYWVDFEDI